MKEAVMVSIQSRVEAKGKVEHELPLQPSSGDVAYRQQGVCLDLEVSEKVLQSSRKKGLPLEAGGIGILSL